MEELRHQAHRDPSKSAPNEVLNFRFGQLERHDRYHAVAFAELGYVAVWSDTLCNPVDGVDSRSHRALDPQIDCHDRVEITINVGEFIQAWPAP